MHMHPTPICTHRIQKTNMAACGCFCASFNTFISRLSMIVRENVVLNRTVVSDSD